MKTSLRARRMGRHHQRNNSVSKLNLVSLMDIFTILVFFLLVNSSSSDVMEPPKKIKLPDSVVEAKPRETVIVMITPEEVLVQGKPVITTREVIESKTAIIEPVKQQLLLQQLKHLWVHLVWQDHQNPRKELHHPANDR